MEAQKRLAQRHSRNSCHMFICIVVCACSRHALDFEILFFTSFFKIKFYYRHLFHVGASQNYCVSSRGSDCGLTMQVSRMSLESCNLHVCIFFFNLRVFIKE